MKSKLQILNVTIGSFVLVAMFEDYKPGMWRVQKVLWVDADGVFLEGEKDDHYARSYHANSWNNIVACSKTPDELLEMRTKAEAIYKRFFANYEATNSVMRAEIIKELQITGPLHSLQLCPICPNCNSAIVEG
jgi:hypothetical protein